MLIFAISIFILLVSIFVIGPLILVGCGKLFKTPNLTFRNALLTSIILFVVGTIFEVLSFGFRAENTLIHIALGIINLVLAVWIVKKRFGIETLRAVGIYFTLLAISVAMALSIRTYGVQAFKIPAGGMLETIQIGDHLLVNKYIYKFKSPEKGDIIVFKYPEDPAQDYLKRIVAVGGDVVEIKNKELYVNNVPRNETYVIHNDRRILSTGMSPRDNYGPVTVPENSYFVMGDNRDNSLDSRFWGFVDSKYIKGKAFVIYWSWDKENQKSRMERIGKTL